MFCLAAVQLTYGPLFAATQNLYLLVVLQSLSDVRFLVCLLILEYDSCFVELSMWKIWESTLRRFFFKPTEDLFLYLLR